MTKRIILQRSPDSNRTRLIVNGEVVHDGPGIPESVWLDLLEDEFDADVTEEEKSVDRWEECL